MDDQEKREAGRAFGETLRQKLAANRRGFTAERFAERLGAGREGQVARWTEESAERHDRPPAGAGGVGGG